MAIFKCKMCGGDLVITEGMTVCECEYCGTQQTVPRLDDDRKANLYDRAGHFRRNNDYDKAIAIYERILDEDRTDAEAYWSLLLCRYGIEYVEDPATHKRVPTVNRAQYTSVFADEDYKAALKYADAAQRAVYESEAKAIDDIQKGILEISSKEKPFDVFICYKETDNNGRRTPDSVLATDLYHQLTNEGFKVFFSRITLEDKLGSAYEPYIFAALNSARVMVVLGTKAEHFNAVWVRNEWSRYLALMKRDKSRTLIPAYRDMDPYDLPEEFSHLQAQDMSKLGFMQDLIRGIKKITKRDEAKPQPAAAPAQAAQPAVAKPATGSLLDRVQLFLEDGKWNDAEEYCNKVLDLDARCARAYFYMVMAKNQIRDKAGVEKYEDENGFTNDPDYQKALRFADDGYRAELERINKQVIYNGAAKRMSDAKKTKLSERSAAYAKAKKGFASIAGFKASDANAAECERLAAEAEKLYREACERQAAERRAIEEKAAADRRAIEERAAADRRASEERAAAERRAREEREAARIAKREAARLATIRKVKKITIIVAPVAAAVVVCIFLINIFIVPPVKYQAAEGMLAEGRYVEAAVTFGTISGYKDAKDKSLEAWEKAADQNTLSAGYSHTIGLKNDGMVVATGENEAGRYDVTGWKDIASVSAGFHHMVGLKNDGTVVATGDNDNGQCNISGWRDIVAISAGGYHTVGLKHNRTVIAAGSNEYGQCNVSGWRDIVAVSVGEDHTVGLIKDGTVVAAGSNYYQQCNISGWNDIVAVTAGFWHTVGVKKDGTVVAVGSNNDGRCDVSSWRDIAAISAGSHHTVGLKKDGTVVAVGSNNDGQCNVGGWAEIVAVSAGAYHTVGLKRDGTVVAVGKIENGECDVSGWTDIMFPPSALSVLANQDK